MSKSKSGKKSIKIVSIISVVFFLLAFSLLIFATLSMNNDNMTLFGCRFFYVMTGSMEPDIKAESFIVVKETAVDDLEQGDVISFLSRDPEIEGMINTHEIHSIEIDEQGNSYFVTKGTANPTVDEYPVYPEDIRGRVIWDSHAVGIVFKFLSNRIVSFCLTVLPIAVIVVINLIDLFVIINSPEKKDENGQEPKTE